MPLTEEPEQFRGNQLGWPAQVARIEGNHDVDSDEDGCIDGQVAEDRAQGVGREQAGSWAPGLQGLVWKGSRDCIGEGEYRHQFK